MFSHVTITNYDRPECALTLNGGRLGGICEITDFIPLVPDRLRSHGSALLSHDLALGALPAHCTHGHTNKEVTARHNTYSISEPESEEQRKGNPSGNMNSTHIYRPSLHQPEYRYQRMSQHTDGK